MSASALVVDGLATELKLMAEVNDLSVRLMFTFVSCLTLCPF